MDGQAAVRAAEADLERRIIAALTDGTGWAAIAQSLGMSKTTTYRRYSHLVPRQRSTGASLYREHPLDDAAVHRRRRPDLFGGS